MSIYSKNIIKIMRLDFKKLDKIKFIKNEDKRTWNTRKLFIKI